MPHRHVAKVPAPHQLSGHRIAEEAARSERGIQMNAVGARRVGRKPVGFVRSLMGNRPHRGSRPFFRARGAVEAEHAKVEFARHSSDGHRRGHEHRLIPDHWGRGSATRDFNLPAEVFCGAKLDWWRGRGGRSVAVRTPPVPPLIRHGLPGALRVQDQHRNNRPLKTSHDGTFLQHCFPIRSGTRSAATTRRQTRSTVYYLLLSASRSASQAIATAPCCLRSITADRGETSAGCPCRTSRASASPAPR